MMKRKLVSIIGHFAFGRILLDGQTIKTKIISQELEKQIGEKDIIKIDTYGKKIIALIKAPFQCVSALLHSNNVIILPAHNGVRVFVPLLSLFKKIFRKRIIHYVIIGGWLPKLISNKPTLRKQLKSFDYIYAETNTVKQKLNNIGLNNVVVMQNFKNLKKVSKESKFINESRPLRLCIFSRISQQKGIGDAIEAIKTINTNHGYTVYSLDIYGQIDADQIDWFNLQMNSFPDYIRYLGKISFDESVSTIEGYFALLFPTRFFTEGVPGTIIDAYFSGVPVICSKWESFHDVVDEGVTGMGYEFCNVKELIRLLESIMNKPKKVIDMRKMCIEKSKMFEPQNAIQPLMLRLKSSGKL